MLGELLPLFFTDSQRFLGNLHTALSSNQAGMVARAAHGLRGASAVIGATACFALCNRLEQAAEDNDLTRARFLTDAISAELNRLKRAC